MGESLGYAFASTPVGEIIVVADDEGIRFVSWGENRDSLAAEARNHFSRAELIEGAKQTSSLAPAVADIARDARHADANLPLSLRGTPFQKEVWDALRDIPPGETRTYAEVAAQVGRPTAYRAAAQACARNPAPIVVPCHRVVASNGGLGGFSGGLWRKKELLEREGVRR